MTAIQATAAARRPALASTRHETSAIRGYQIRQANIAELLATLQGRLAAHAERAATEPGHWGYEGDLSAIQARLAEAVDSLAPVL